MKVENRAYASPIYALFVSQGSRAQCFNERPGPHSNGLKPSAPPHCVASSRNKAVCAFLLVPRPRGWLLLLVSATVHALHYCKGDECESDEDETPSTMYS